MPKVSIIVPIHNAGEHLHRCLDSLVSQTLKDIEIILVLDCPTDGSDKVACEYAKNDDRVVILENNDNLHTGLSRNRGIEIARGEYIGFHDHDDYSDPRMYELLYHQAKAEQLDVVRCDFNCVYTYSGGERIEPYVYPELSYTVENKAWIAKYVAGDKISCVIWNHIYKAKFLRENKINFLDSRQICSEDSIFFFQVYSKLNQLGIVSEYLYDHVFHQTNTGKVYDYRSIKNRIAFFDKLYALLLSAGVSDSDAHKMFLENVARSFYTASRQALILLPLKQAKIEIRQLQNNPLIMQCIRLLFKRENRTLLRSLKPTIIMFCFYLKTMSKI